MYPVAASGGSRQAPVEIELGGFRIPARTQLWVPNHPLLNSPRNWDRPGEFLPGRWADPDAEFAITAEANPDAAARNAGGSPAAEDPAANLTGSGHPNGGARRATWADGASGDGEGGGKRPRRFLPFSAGARDCVGQSLAKMNYTATLALLLSSFSFRLAEEVRPPPGHCHAACVRCRTPGSLLCLKLRAAQMSCQSCPAYRARVSTEARRPPLFAVSCMRCWSISRAMQLL